MSDVVADVKRGLCNMCWYASCGGAALSTFELAFGKKIARSVIARASAASDEFCEFEGEANLLVWCTWRLDDAAGPITSSDDTTANVVRSLKQLVGHNVVDVQVDLPGWDLHLEFTGGLRLHVFCDHVPGDPSWDGNWELFLSDKMIAIGVGSKCEIEPRSP